MPPASTMAAKVRKWRRFIFSDAPSASTMTPHWHWTYQGIYANSQRNLQYNLWHVPNLLRELSPGARQPFQHANAERRECPCQMRVATTNASPVAQLSL